jgi:hypothetical protein
VTWEPAPRPDWVRAVNDGSILPIAQLARLPFERDLLLSEARARLGVADGGMADFGDDAFIEPLDVLVRALEDEAELTVIGRWMTRRFLLRFLEVRLHMTEYLKSDPGARDEEIHAPLVITGAPRTGTTILHSLLAQDPGRRAPRGWELLRPLPPPDPRFAETDPRILLTDRELRLPAEVSGDLDSIHEYSGRMYKECISAMTFAFRSEEFTARYHVPTYERWLQRCDMRPAYEMHRLVLQVLQRRYSDIHWVLKSPVHMHALPTLFAAYPDARMVVTHRDPLTVLGSLTSLVATLRWAHSDHVDFAEIGRDHARRWQEVLDGLVDRAERAELDPARTHHVRYTEFVADPIATIGEIYPHLLGVPLDPTTADTMRTYLAARPQDKHGPHSYSFADLGLDSTAVRARFTRYQEYFTVPDEAT